MTGRTGRLVWVMVLALLLVACGAGEQAVSDTAVATVAPVVGNDEATNAEAAAPVTDNDAAAGAEAETAAPAAESEVTTNAGAATEAPPVESDEAAVAEAAQPSAPVEVVAFTPAQQEGPFYPVAKPDDRDNDLVTLAGAAGLPAGQVLELDGTVYDASGYPLPGLTIEIWQTDEQGVYDHPQDRGYASRDLNFQFYGEAMTGADGRYTFRTIVPGEYEPRPRHIHVKILRDGQELLTTQFYFADELALQGADALLLIDAQPATDAAGNPILTGTRDLFLNVPGAG